MRGLPADGPLPEDVVHHSEQFRRVSEGLVVLESGEVPGMEGPAVIMACDQFPAGALVRAPKRGISTFHETTPDLTQRLVRMVEELLERDDVRMGSDNLWYWNRLQEIKEEINRGQEPRGEAESVGCAESEKGPEDAAD